MSICAQLGVREWEEIPQFPGGALQLPRRARARDGGYEGRHDDGPLRDAALCAAGRHARKHPGLGYGYGSWAIDSESS